jgi:hypothetical protein
LLEQIVEHALGQTIAEHLPGTQVEHGGQVQQPSQVGR